MYYYTVVRVYLILLARSNAEDGSSLSVKQIDDGVTRDQSIVPNKYSLEQYGRHTLFWPRKNGRPVVLQVKGQLAFQE